MKEKKVSSDGEPLTRKQRVGRIVLISVLALVCLLCVLVLIGVVVFHRYYMLIDYQPVDTSIPRLTDEELSRVLEDLYSGESFAPEESELPEESREALDTSMDQALVPDTSSESEEEEESVPDISYEELSKEETIDPAESEDPSSQPPIDSPELSHVLVIGMDVNDINARARADTMIVVTLNKSTGKIVLTSLLRDLYVAIPGYPNGRLNASFALGNVALLEKTIYTNFGITIDRYIAIDFTAFNKIIELLDGIELTLTEADMPHVFPGEEKPAGVYTLSGEEALRYARWLIGASDFERTERQRTLMVAVIKRMLQMPLADLLSVMEITLPLVRTDLTEWDCYSILFSMGALKGYPIQTQRLPFPGLWEYATVDKRSVITLDLEENRKAFFESVA